MSQQSIISDLTSAQDVLKKFIADKKNLQAIESAGNLMLDALRDNKKILSCGNGGSMCDAMHFAEEMSGRFREDRKALAAISISDPSHLSCVGNDYGYERVFSRYIEGLGQAGDVLLAISTSGNSKNIINAVMAAKTKKMKVIGLTGKNGGEMADLVDVEVRAPYSEYADRAQEIHIKVIHALIHYVEEHLG